MNLKIIQDSLNVFERTIEENNIEPNENINWLFWIAIVQFIIIFFLAIKLSSKRNQSLKQKLKKESLDNSIDFDNIINSSFNSNEVYNELKVKCHPDRFPNDNKKNVIAENLFQEITKNKNNIKRLLELKEKAKQELNIKF
jgi:curved DNA-binding protein CbpA